MDATTRHSNSASDELLIHNTADGHFYEWWIASAQLTGVDLGPSMSIGGSGGEPGVGALGSASGIAAAGMPSLATSMGAMGGSGARSPAALMSAADPMPLAGATAGPALETGPSSASASSTPLVVQAMASFSARNAAVDAIGALMDAGPVQQPEIAAAFLNQHLVHA